jgi:hypothetical protein
MAISLSGMSVHRSIIQKTLQSILGAKQSWRRSGVSTCGLFDGGSASTKNRCFKSICTAKRLSVARCLLNINSTASGAAVGDCSGVSWQGTTWQAQMPLRDALSSVYGQSIENGREP